MAAFNFPNSPSTNDLHTENGVTYKWNGTVWKRQNASYTDATNLNVTGISTVGSITGVAATFTGNVQIGGVLTYEDVKNVDSVGIVTARTGIHIDDSITHIGDTDTKIRFPAADTITAETGGSERLRITGGGKVGIGTEIPSELLEIASSVGCGIAIKDDNNGFAASKIKVENGGRDLSIGAPQDIFFKDIDTGTKHLYIESTGHIGIGTDNPTQKLDIRDGNILLDAFNNSGDGGIFFRPGFTVADSNSYNISILAYDHSGANKDGLSLNAYDGISFCTGSNTRDEKVRIDAAGKVLVGHTSVIEPDGYASSLQVTGTNTAAGISILRYSNNSGGPTLLLGKSRGATIGSFTKVQDGDSLGKIEFYGTDTGWESSASVRACADGEWYSGSVGSEDNTDAPGRLEFHTTANGSDNMVERLRIDSNGRLTLNNSEGIKLSAVTSSLYALDGSLSYYATNNGVYLNGAGASGWLRLNASGADNFRTCIDLYGQSYSDPDVILFRTAGAERLRITNNGHVRVPDDGKFICGGDSDIKYYHSGGTNYCDIANGQQLYFRVNGANKFYVQSGGAQFVGSLYGDDNNKIQLGNSQDLKIYHDGNSFINTSSGYLNIDVGNENLYLDANEIRLRGEDGGEILARFIDDGACQLYHDNIKRLETTSTGATVSGSDITLTNTANAGDASLYMTAGEAGSCQIKFHADEGDNATDKFRILVPNSDGIAIQGYNGSSWENYLKGEGDQVELYYDNNIKLTTKSFGIQIEATPRVDLISQGNSVELKFIGNASSHRGSVYADNGNTIGFLKAGTGSWAARWHNNGKQTAHGDIVPNSNGSYTLGNSSLRWVYIYSNNALNTSDRNEKNTIIESDLGLDFVNQLKPVSYKWNKDDGKTHYGLIAQDIEETVLTEGKEITDFGFIDKPKEGQMSLAYNELISPLIKAVQELSAENTTLKARLDALEGS